MYIVNTWVTRGTPWILKSYTTLEVRSVDELPEVKDLKVVNELINIIEKMKVKVNIPHPSSAIPRYYLVIIDEKMELIDIVGVRRDLTPTKWSYRFGYWHPQCQVDILNTLNTLKKMLQSSQT